MEYEQDNSQLSRPPDIIEEEGSPTTSGVEEPQHGTAPASEASETDLMAAMQHLIGTMEQLRQEFDTKLLYDASKERQIDSLHNELQAYRAGLHFKILRPVILDLISMHDDLSRMIEGIPHTEDGMVPAARVLKNLASFQVTIEESLQRNGVEPYSLESDTFVSGKQRVLQAVETTDSSLDKQIERRVRKGFEYEEKILRPELVTTYRAVTHA
jgi:molecular chaperone GrpE